MNAARVGPMDRRTAVLGVLISFALLVPGLLLPVLSLRGTLDPAGVAAIAPDLLDRGLSDSTVAALQPMLNPALVPLLEVMPGGVKGAVIGAITGQMGASLQGSEPFEVYQQTRSILGSVRHLYRVGSVTAATLILLFSVVVPLLKGVMVLLAAFQSDPVRRERLVGRVVAIGKWSMADVFAVALIIAWLAGSATSTAVPGTDIPLLAFEAGFGPGFYWFSAYCLVSLFAQQATLRQLRQPAESAESTPR